MTGKLINVQVFQSSGVYTPPQGTQKVVIDWVGGGGSHFGPMVLSGTGGTGSVGAPTRRADVKPSISGLQTVAGFHSGLGLSRWSKEA